MTEQKVNYIDIGIMEKMCHPIAVAIFDEEGDPIAKFNEHDLALLDSALNNPRQAFGGQELYPTFTKKAASLYYGLIKNHPFKNGNKRIATASLLIFLYMNNYWIGGNHKENEDYLIDLAIRVSKSPGIQDRDLVLLELEKWLEEKFVKN